MAAFLSAAAFVVLHHEPWRDECEPWLIARESAAVGPMLEEWRYVGHPRLWALCLYALSRLGREPLLMQGLHLALAVAAVAVFTAYAPLPATAKVLFAFGYFPFFEYAAVSRPYVIGELLVFSSCALLSRPRARPLAVGALLFLLAQTSAYGVIVAIALGAGAAAGRVWGDGPPLTRREAWSWAAGGTLTVASAAWSIAQMRTPPGGAYAFAWQPSFAAADLAHTVAAAWRAYVPLPRLQLEFWNTNVLDAWPWLQAILGLALLAIALRLFVTSPTALALFASGTGATLLFIHTNRYAAARHVGHLFLLFVAALWLARTGLRWRASWCRRAREWSPPAAAIVLGLGMHAAAGLFAAVMDVRHPFSGGRAAAALAREKGVAELPWAIEPDLIAPALSMALDRPVFHAARRRYVSFLLWDDGRRYAPQAEVAARARALSRRSGTPVIVALDGPATTDLGGTPLGEVTGTIVPDERYYLYVLGGLP